jgi:nucleotide-binding universal stress UspA family protein
MADPDPSQAKVLIDEKEQQDLKGVSSSVEAASAGPGSAGPTPTSAASASTHFSPPTSPPDSPPDARKHSTIDEYYSSRPKHDKLGNPIPERRRPQGAMSSVFGTGKVKLPGDLGVNDPRRPRSPAPNSLPGDLGPNDPRRPSSRNVSPAPSGHSRQGSDPSDSPGGRRILKDPKPPPPPESEPADSDQDGDADYDTENETNESARGRQKKRPEPGRTTSGKAVNVRGDSADSEIVFPQFQGDRKPDPTKGESAISFKLSTPAEKAKLKKRVHPMSAFDSAPSGYSTPLGSDDESHSEMLAAQKLSLTMSAVHSTPSAHRVIRQIIRGDYAHFQREAEEGRKRQRMYLVATDISPEAEYALEWTIGTVLRDGDTLFAVYAADEEAASEGGVEIGHGAENVRDTARIIRDLPATTNAVPQSTRPSPLAQSATPGEGAGRPHSSAEAERRHAVEDITERCVRLLRKTRLQVRVVVEVFHCKSPRHMITELIDFLSPTLVIIGSRGRSAVKGVLLGSFSNYLVTKSSVPVMVARKKLRKHSKTVRNRDGTTVPYSGITGRAGRLSNVIEAPKGKGLRVQGWDKVGID